MPSLTTKLPRVGTTIFTVMSRLAEQHGAINLSQGFPDFDPPSDLIALVAERLGTRCHQYAPMPGVLRLREAIAAKVAMLYGARVDPETEITVTSGATEAIFDAVQAVVRAGDDVIVLDPCYDSYEPSIVLAGARPVHVPLTTEFRIDWQRLADALSPRTRLVMLNSPHNPSGALIDAADLDRLAALLEPLDCYVLSDEVYEHIVFDGQRHASALSQPVLRERSFAVFSFGKTYHATGWKLGYCVAPPALTAELRKVHQYVTFASTTPFQHAIADYMSAYPEHALDLPRMYEEKRDHFARLLGRTRFTLRPSAGTYFQLADYSAISDLSDVEFARKLTIEHGVASIPISVFYAQPPDTRLVRFCFAKQEITLESAAKRLAQV